MRCPQCQTELPDEAKFCLECGHGLKADMPAIQPHLTPEPERKHVTALFSDLSGYTAMTEKLDPEQVKEITGRIFTGVKQIVAKYEGFIERVMGDGCLAFFGIPRAHEDDPIRAIHAAIEIHGLVKGLSPEYEIRVGAPLSMHSGINTGLVVTADVDPEKGTHGVAGDAVNVASRLSGMAGPGEILVGEETVRRAKGRFVFDDLGKRQAKGKTEPITVFKLISVKASASGIGVDRQVSSEMVGRDRELDRLELQVMKAINGEGSVVNIIGEAGIGKSRLIAELKKREVMKRVTLLEGRAISIGKNLSFHPIIDLLKQWAGIAEADSEAAAFDKLEKAIREVHPDEAHEILPFVATLMGMKLIGKHAERVKGIEGEALEKLIFKNVRELVIKGAELRPTVVVMEDLHWADTSSIELLEALCRLAEKHRIAFANVFRPGYFESDDGKIASIGTRLPGCYVEVTIQALDKTNSETLINNMLAIKGLPFSVKNQIVERAGGNPFFIEEVVRSLIDEGAVVKRGGGFEVTAKIEKVVIPPTINDVLMARIDRLEERTRELVKVASVIGRSFFDRIIKDVADAIGDVDHRLEYLKDVQLIQDRVRMQELEYLFKHALAQEAAYESTLIQQRKALHLKVAQAIEKVFQERLHEFYGMLAFHYTKGEDLDKAEDYMTRAGEEALRSSASSEAIAYFLQALQLYTEKHGDTADPEKLAAFEKNIALAYFNRGRWENARHYFDKVLWRWGRRLPKNKVSIMAKLAYDLLIIRLRLHLPWTRSKSFPDERTREFFDLALKKDIALLSANPRRFFLEMIGEFRESFQYDLAKLDMATVFHLTTSVLFSYAGFFRINKLVLKHASQRVDPNKIQEVACYKWVSCLYNYVVGKWTEIPEYDQSFIDAATRNGLFWDTIGYLCFQGEVNIYRGKFSLAQELVERIILLEEKYRYGPFVVDRILAAELLLVCRRLNLAHTEANNAVSRSVDNGVEAWELQSVGWRAVIQVLKEDISGAKDSLVYGERIRRKQVFWPPWQLRSSVLAQFMIDLHLLENGIGGNSRSSLSDYSKAAFTSGKKALRNSAKVVAHLPENYRLMGEYYWLTGEQRKALKWFDKSIKEGERLGTRPDLSRTYMEAGKRLLERHSKYRELNGISAREYLDKAEAMFREMDLEWDLEQLERVRMGLA
jgi:class 3 adenylate cyclase/tetratricopeptide (TPR) repeat protein